MLFSRILDKRWKFWYRKALIVYWSFINLINIIIIIIFELEQLVLQAKNCNIMASALA